MFLLIHQKLVLDVECYRFSELFSFLSRLLGYFHRARKQAILSIECSLCTNAMRRKSESAAQAGDAGKSVASKLTK